MKIIKFEKKNAEISSHVSFVRLPFFALPIQIARTVRWKTIYNTEVFTIICPSIFSYHHQPISPEQ